MTGISSIQKNVLCISTDNSTGFQIRKSLFDIPIPHITYLLLPAPSAWLPVTDEPKSIFVLSRYYTNNDRYRKLGSFNLVVK